MSANHCYENPANVVFWFNWESPTCSNPGSSPPADSMSGATQRSRRAASDFWLMEINNLPPASYNVYYSGIDWSNAQPSSTVGIHHPSGDIKKFSIDNDPPTTDNYSSGSNGSHWRVVDWDDGTTEGGSSGSPLYDQNQRIVGQLHGGGAACGNNASDWYGQSGPLLG